MPYVLLAAVFLPLLGALVFTGPRKRVRRYALAVTLVVFALAVVLVAQYPVGGGDFAVTDVSWLGDDAPIDVRFSVGLDGLSLWLFALTALLMITSVLVSWWAIRERASRFYRLLLLLESGMLGVFVSRDIILFYIFFEFTLIPLFLLIGMWGSEQRRYAAAKFFLFTLAGSVLTFLGLLALVLWSYSHSASGVMTFSIPQLTENLAALRDAGRFPVALQVWIFIALFAGFAIKVPLFPLHTWLPLAHVQAPAAGSVLLAGILLKIGTYGFVRFSLPMLPDATVACMPWLLWLSVAGIIYGALVALAQKDIKRLIAYSSVSHLGFCMLGIFSLTRLGMQGGVLQMINHGLSTGGLFAIVGMLYERYHTRQIADLGGLARRTPILAFFMLVMTLSSIGLPGLNGFVGEFMLLLGMFQRGFAETAGFWAVQYQVIAVLAVSGVVLGAWYMLHLVQRVFFGPLKEPDHDEEPVEDLSNREILALAPLSILIVWIGVQPEFFLKRMEGDVDALAQKAMNVAAVQLQAAGKETGDRGQGAGAREQEPAYGILGTQYAVQSPPSFLGISPSASDGQPATISCRQQTTEN